MIKEFKEFLLRGNLLDLAVAVVIGAAFTGVVTAITRDIVTPLIKAVFGGATQFNSLSVTVHGSKILYGDVLTALLNFVIVAAVLFFLVIKPVNHLMRRLGRTPRRTRSGSAPSACRRCPRPPPGAPTAPPRLRRSPRPPDRGRRVAVAGAVRDGVRSTRPRESGRCPVAHAAVHRVPHQARPRRGRRR